MFEFPNFRFIQFAKAPELGRVKTRMHPVLNEEECLALHKMLTRTAAQRIAECRLCPLELWVGSQPSHPFFRQLSEDLNLPVYCQCEGDLGQRMQAAAAATLERAEGVVLVGSDCPFFTPWYLRQALRSLCSGADAVVGPALDGGYVLLGLRQVAATLFSGIEWGSELVWEQTREKLENLAWRYRELPVLADIDRPEDLRRLPLKNRTINGQWSMVNGQ